MKSILMYLIIIIIASNLLLIMSIVFSKWFRRWRRTKRHKGLIDFLGLSEWFSNLAPEERELFKHYYARFTRTGEWVDSLTDGKIYSTSEKPSQLLWMVAASAVLNEDYRFAEKLLAKAQSLCETPWERQQVHVAYAYLYFKQKDLLAGARENCIHYCEGAIRNIEKYGSPVNLPTLPFDHLITIYEEDRLIDKAREIILKAISLSGKRNPKLREQYEKKLKSLEELA